jgi:hypothetical protein
VADEKPRSLGIGARISGWRVTAGEEAEHNWISGWRVPSPNGSDEPRTTHVGTIAGWSPTTPDVEHPWSDDGPNIG